MRVLSTIVFVLSCYFIGGVAAISLTCLIFDLNFDQISEVLKHPQVSDRSVVFTQAFLFTAFGFVIVPTVYLFLVRGNSIAFLRNTGWLKLRIFLLTMLLSVSVLPLVSVLIELNHKVSFPGWLSELETYFQEMENAARRFTSFMLTFRSTTDLVVAILVIALVPGFAEEYFFRGVVQGQLQKILKNPHCAILLSAFLFSLFHFQFYGLIPRFTLGVLYGYMFGWSGNIWYPIIAHMVNNSIGVLLVYCGGRGVLEPAIESPYPLVLVLASIFVSAAGIFYMRRKFSSSIDTGTT